MKQLLFFDLRSNLYKGYIVFFQDHSFHPKYLLSNEDIKILCFISDDFFINKKFKIIDKTIFNVQY
jgi:hypothetical protein